MPIHAEVSANPKSDRFRKIHDLTGRHARERAGRFLVEGPQAVRELVHYIPQAVLDVYVAVESAEPDAPFVSAAVAHIAADAMHANCYVHKVTRTVAERVSADCQGIFAVASMARFHEWVQTAPLSERPFVAAFWQVRDPGNAGTVIRSADAAGCAAVIFVDDCVDPLNPKVIRSTTGSLFHIPVLHMDTNAFLAWSSDHHCRTVAADVYGTADHKPQSLPDWLRASHDEHGVAVLFGNEARGLELPVLERMNAIVSIPMYGKAESLNLATSASIMLMSMAMSSHVETM